MFNVDTDNNVISLSKGDTGAIEIAVDGYTFGENDRALFSIQAGNGQIVKQKICQITDNKITITFFNADTDTLPPGGYSWDVRYVINPYYNDNGDIVDGDQVLTPNLPMECNLLQIVGDI